MTPIRLLHVITGLATAGAETALRELAAGLDRARFEIRIIALRANEAEVAAFSRETGWPVESLAMRGPLDAPRALVTLRRRVAAFNPHLIQSWLYHADLLAALARAAAPRAKLVWSLRNTSLSAERRLDWRLLTLALARLSGSVDLVIANADAALHDHQALGYRPRATRVIPNGWLIPASVDPHARAATRATLGLREADVAILMPARLAAQKDHATYLAAARLAADRVPGLRFFAAGQGVTADALERLAASNPVTALGPRDDVRVLMSAMDAITLTSAYGEGCPNGLGEAMARAVPVIATTVGGVSSLVGDAGLLVPSRDPERLAGAFIDLANRAPDERARLGARGRARIDAAFRLDQMVARHVAVYEALLAGG